MKRRLLACALLTMAAPVAYAALADLSDQPLVSVTSADVKPNVMFVLDDSGSMDWMFMPDALDDRLNDVGARNWECNTVYYNPNLTYLPPKNADGTRKASRTFTAACTNGYSSSPGCTNDLSTSFAHQGRWDPFDSSPQPAYYYVHSKQSFGGTAFDGVSAITKLSPLSSSCTIKVDASQNTTEQPWSWPNTIADPSGGSWTKRVVSATSGPGGTDERTNFANWYSYYRKRLMMMKAAVGEAFDGINNRYRVGFITINPMTGDPATINASKFLKPAPFEGVNVGEQKRSWFDKLYGASTSGSTPLRPALSRVGRYFAGKNDGINAGMIPTAADDPVQYSCQQNFTILTTDGYWNGGGGSTLDGSSMDTQTYDSNVTATDAQGTGLLISGRPMFDGASQVRTTIDKLNHYQVAACTVTVDRQRTLQWQQQSGSITKTIYQLQSNDGQQHYYESYLQRRQRTLETRTSANSGATWTGWAATGSGGTSSCTIDASGSSRRDCRYAASWSSWSNQSSCTVVNEQTSTANGAVWALARQCQYTAYTDQGTTSSCTPVAQSPGPTNYTAGTARTCSVVWNGWVNASSCTVDNSGTNRRDCREITVSTEPNAPSCTESNAGGVRVTCDIISGGPWTNTTGPCVATPTNFCQSIVIQDWTNVASCTPSGPDGSGVEVICDPGSGSDPGNRIQYRTQTTTTTQNTSGGVDVGSPTVTNSYSAWTNMAAPEGTCMPTASGTPTAPTPNPRRPVDPEPPLPTAPCTAWPCVSYGALTAGANGTLADVAQYYYVNDLRPTLENNVPAAGSDVEADRATWQHMSTYTLGLGLSGTIAYAQNYKQQQTAADGNFGAIREGTLNWPAPSADSPSALDDLWHAAVNGRGQYFSASDPESVASSLRTALSGLNARVASAAAAATSNLEPVAGDNFAYLAKYKTQSWYGDIEAHAIALADGVVDGENVVEGQVLDASVWTAATQLNNKVGGACDTRTIKLFRSGATDNMVDFKWNTYACDGSKNPTGAAVTTLDATEQGYFGSTQVSSLGQYPDMGDGSGTTYNQRAAAAGYRMVNFIRGQRGNEVNSNADAWDAASSTQFYRKRGDTDLDTVLGDIVNAQPLFVRKPFALYEDTGYAAFKSANASRASMVYVASNDGMLHAFNGNDGSEAWAFMPRAVLPELHKLTNRDYATAHRFLVDGSPVAGDVFDGTNWRTIVVGGLNKGGKSYYALDVTDPAAPKALWEFTDANLGYSYGNPLIGKLADGTWAVFVTSGVNNADGKGHLYVLNAVTGALLSDIVTCEGSAGTPSNLMKIAGWSAADPIINNTVSHIYGADMAGNVWRFDVNDSIAPTGLEATKLITVTDAGGTPQPITVKPLVSLVGTEIFVYVGTGRYLGSTDMTSTQVQSVYGIKDPMTEPASACAPVVVNGRTDLIAQTVTQTGSGASQIRTVTSCTNSTPNGWYVNLPDSKERVNVDMQIQLGTLIVASNVPDPQACNVGGYSWLNYFDLRNGCGIADGKVGQRLADALAVGINVIRLPSGKTKVIATLSDAETITLEPPIAIGNPEGRRLTWREITN